MTKWKCERCDPECNFACYEQDLPMRCHLKEYGVYPDWHKVETVEEWLDLEDEPECEPMSQEDRIQMLMFWNAQDTEDIDNMKERIEKLEEQHLLRQIERWGELVKKLCHDVEELKNQMRSLSMHSHPTVGMEMERMNEEIEQLKKKAHEHTSTFQSEWPCHKCKYREGDRVICINCYLKPDWPEYRKKE